MRKVFHERGLRAHVVEDRRELATDRTGAENHDAAWDFLNLKDRVRIHYLLVVDFDAGQGLGDRPGSENDIFCLQDLFARLAGHLDFTLPDLSALARDHRYLVLLHQVRLAIGALGNHLVLVLLCLRPVDGWIFQIDPYFRRSQHVAVELSRPKQGFGGNAAAKQTGPAQTFVSFDNRRLQTKLSRANRRDVAAWARTDDHHIKRLSHENLHLSEATR